MDIQDEAYKRELLHKQAQMELFELLNPSKDYRFPHESWAVLYEKEKKNDLPKL